MCVFTQVIDHTYRKKKYNLLFQSLDICFNDMLMLMFTKLDSYTELLNVKLMFDISSTTGLITGNLHDTHIFVYVCMYVCMYIMKYVHSAIYH